MQYWGMTLNARNDLPKADILTTVKTRMYQHSLLLFHYFAFRLSARGPR